MYLKFKPVFKTQGLFQAHLQIFILLALLTFVNLFTSCKTMPTTPDIGMDTSKTLPLDYICPSYLEWEPIIKKNSEEMEIVEGFEKISYELKDLRVRWTCIKADLNTEGLKIVATPTPEELGMSPTLTSVKSFAKKNNAIVAVNATPWKNKSYPHDAVGIVKINGTEFYPPSEHNSAICFSENPLRAKIIEKQTEEEIAKYPYAFGGFSQVLKAGELIPYNNNRRSRVSIGTNSNGSKLYFFIVTTIMNPNDRNGFTFEECGLIMQKLGCTDAMHFDGGHSSCLVINAKESQKPLLNRKIPIAIGLKK